MNLKSFCAAVFAAVVTATAVSAADLPKFGEDSFYYVKFVTNGSIIRDYGTGNPVKNAMAEEGVEGQQWKLIGSAESCTLTSDLGNSLLYDKDNNRFSASASEATALKLVESDAGKWELQLADESLAPAEGSVALVMNGGSGTGKFIDLWKHNFAACGLEFTEAEQMDFTTQPAPAPVAEVNIRAKAGAPEEPLTLWYRSPATNWVTEALPIGGGDFGAMVFGGVAQERIQFNHKTLWRGSERTGDLGTYLSFGDLYIIDNKAADVTNYRRALDLTNAMATVEFERDGATYTREYLASYPDQVIAIRLKASEGTPLDLEFRLINAQGNRATYTAEGARFSGTLSNGMNYAASATIVSPDGTAEATRNGVRVSNASEVTVYLACDTNFDPTGANHLSGESSEAIAQQTAERTEAARAKGFEAVRSAHEEDYSGLFDRVEFALDGATGGFPIPSLLEKQTTAKYAAMLDMLVFQYGRYLTIASSRGVALPSNLQGIWCKDGTETSSAVWASDIHANINVQMNYWPAEPTNLSECHMPFLEYIRNEATRTGGTWQKNARDLGVSKGWVVNTAGNIFGGSSTYKAGKYSVANAWFCEHLWQHYTYTRDRDYLTSTAWPLMKSTCEFWFERLKEGPDGLLECPYEYSPEQGKVQDATAHSQQLVTQLFINTLAAADELDMAPEDEFLVTLRGKLAKIDRGLRIDSDGLLREWKYQENTPNQNADSNYFADDEQNVWKGHRHTSHLMALYPGFEIDPGNDAEIFEAAVKSLDDRGDVATGWARAWRISLWARARDKARVYTTLRGFSHRTTALNYDWHGGLYDNLLDAHATSVFQIEGNFGATAGIAEILMQSRPDSLVLLPALPAKWATGKMHGLRAIGNFEVDLDWADGQLTTLVITSGSGRPLTLAYPAIDKATVTDSQGNRIETTAARANLLTFNTAAGETYTVSPAADDDDDDSALSAPATADDRIRVSNGQITIGDRPAENVYNMTGQRCNPEQRLAAGVYIVSRESGNRPVVVKPDFGI